MLSWRMAKKHQMRWSDEGAHLLAQVRVLAINGELHPRAYATPLRAPKPSDRSSNDACFVPNAAYLPLWLALFHGRSTGCNGVNDNIYLVYTY